MRGPLIVLAVCILMMANAVNAQDSTWVWQNPLPQGNTLKGLFVFDANSAIAVGGPGIVVKTINGGSIGVCSITWET